MKRKLSDVSSSDIPGDEIVDTPSSAKTGTDNFDIKCEKLSDTLFSDKAGDDTFGRKKCKLKLSVV